MNLVDRLFDHLDDWRHLPNYQLERRADVFFSLYLAGVLAAKYCCAIQPIIVPEFPLRIGSITNPENANKSFKVDYFALSEHGDQAFLVELKTDSTSRREKQDWYLRKASEAGLKTLLRGVLDIFAATAAKRKYYHLLLLLEELKLLAIPPFMKELARKDSLVGITEASRGVIVECGEVTPRIVYIQPHGDSENSISFNFFANVVRRHDDELSVRFAKSLDAWAGSRAGSDV